MAQIITEGERTKIYDDLANIMIDTVERQLLPLEEIKRSSKYVLDHLDAVKTDEELMNFLAELGKKWQMYNGVYLKVKDQKLQTADEAKIQELKAKLASLSA